MDGAAEQAKGCAQAAQRHAGLVDAGGPGACEHDGPVFQDVGAAAGHDEPQSGLGIGVSAKSRLGRRGHGGRR